MTSEINLWRGRALQRVLLAGVCGLAVGLAASPAGANEFPPVVDPDTLVGSNGFEMFGSSSEPYAGTTSPMPETSTAMAAMT